MALINCSECEGKVSDKAAACPHCGNPIRTPQPDQPHAAPPQAAPPRVKTPDDNYLTRNRGCGDLVLYGGLLFILLVLIGIASSRPRILII